MASVELLGVTKVFTRGVESVSSVDLVVDDGLFQTVVGPSGSGKSTLLRLVAGLEAPTRGTVRIGGRDVTKVAPRERDVAMVFQNPALHPHLSVFENLAFGLRAKTLGRPEVRSRVETVAEMLGLSKLLERKPQALSGGERQRVALGRAIARRPAVFLFDEPLSSLDAPLRASLRGELASLHRSMNATVVFVTHDQAEALSLGERVGVMDRGRIVQQGPPREIYERPRTRFVGEFIGNPPMSILRCEVTENEGPRYVRQRGVQGGVRLFEAQSPRMIARLEERRGKPLDLGVRPEQVTLRGLDEDRESSMTWLHRTGRVFQVEYLGNEAIVTLTLGGESLRARMPATFQARVRDEFWVGIDLERVCWFDPETSDALWQDGAL